MKPGALLTPKVSLAVTLAWIAILGLTGSTDALLFMAPALLIVIPLLSGHYLGEELIAKLVAKTTRRPKRSPRSAALPAPAAPATWLARGRDLIAFGLAKRPPPPLVLPQN
jgi:hypothetical protein